MQDTCPTSKSGKHYFTVFQVRSDFEPTSFGATAEDTLYKRVEYNYAACNCGTMRKVRVKPVDYNNE